MSLLHIRSATRSDVPAIVEIVADAYAPYVERLGREPAPMMDDYGQLVESDCVWIVETGGLIGGLIVLRQEADHVLVSNVAVARAHQGQGLGRKLLDYAEAVAR
ncbi:GNAT family N-acetyltransferase [Aureimonas phyllosphaerae]|uniref:N-acetylglutamate synthase-like GNAT family acetyltransferase n=1 Tax=Aureimonas phyllosphaerae TaxID=1166078 RepID=A0A7W6BSK1_9HYPH|nr:N-acetylglutamate synthase-like GNAT family acetyltransferase [Aureimonas phyllosphaerae]MBB3961258.1 N-acetylglutamate synthase-like GNAT family acetyltransferase [Aureimonas phyllosphaerae]